MRFSAGILQWQCTCVCDGSPAGHVLKLMLLQGELPLPHHSYTAYWTSAHTGKSCRLACSLAVCCGHAPQLTAHSSLLPPRSLTRMGTSPSDMAVSIACFTSCRTACRQAGTCVRVGGRGEGQASF